MIAISSVFGAVVGAGSDGRMMDKLYLDVYFGDEVSYQYVNYRGNGFELQTRTLNKVFDMYKIKGNGKYKFIISGKIALPDDVGNTVTVNLKSGQFSYNAFGSGSYVTYLNNIAVYNNVKYKDLSVARDSLNNPYLDIRIEVETKSTAHLKSIRKTLSGTSYFIAYTGKQQKRGASSGLKKVSAKMYCMEE